jgi:hypothetical protein
MAKQAADEKEKDVAPVTTSEPEAKPHCGIIMPISDSAGYDPGHWLEVRRLIVRAAQQAGYTAGMVSENDGQDVIHRSIVKNIYHNELVVCDVSSLNPNVMLELGLRMANKKPLIVVFDGEGVYPFDIKNMLYIPYPKGLHHFRVENFIQELTARMIQVAEAAKAGKYEPFLNHFNDVVIEESKLGTTTQSIAETLASLVDEIKSVKSDMQSIGDNAKARTELSTRVTNSGIFTIKEINVLQEISREIFMTDKEIKISMNLQTTVTLVYDSILKMPKNHFLFSNTPSLIDKMIGYQKTARNIIRETIVNLSNYQVI